MINKEDFKEKIIDRIKFGYSVMRDINGDDLKNYDIRIFTVFTHIDSKKEPVLQLRYELEEEKFKLWLATDGENGMTGIPQGDTFEENIDIITNSVCDVTERLKKDGTMWSIDWLGD